MANNTTYLLLFSGFLSFVALTSPANAQQAENQTTPAPDSTKTSRQKPKFHGGPDVAYYFPSSDKTRRAFGDKFVSIGFGAGMLAKTSEKGRFSADVSLIRNRIAESNVFLAPLGINYSRSVGMGSRITPYIGSSVDFYIANLQSRRQDFDVKSGIRTGLGTSLFMGVNYKQRAFLQTRYNQISHMSGFDLSGFSLNTGLRF